MVWDGRASHFCTFKIGGKSEINVSDKLQYLPDIVVEKQSKCVFLLLLSKLVDY